MHPSEFRIDDFASGAKHAVSLTLNQAGGDPLALPVLLVRGSQPGPRLVLSAGVHGDEFEGVQTIFDIYREIDPARLSGDLLAVTALNGPAFWNCSRTSPLDGGNLARVFPGNAAGSPTEAIAWHFDQYLLAGADFYFDLHSAGVACTMPTLVGYDAADSRAKEAALALGFPVVWAHPNIPPGRTVSAAKARNIPCLYAEARGAGRIHPNDLATYTQGVRRLMRHLGMLEPADGPGPPPTVHLYGDGNIDESVLATQRGFLEPAVPLLETVTAGQHLGTLTDLLAQPLEAYTAPRSGRVALIHACPRVLPGEPVFLVTGETS
jgi:predicted deacylase